MVFVPRSQPDVIEAHTVSGMPLSRSDVVSLTWRVWPQAKVFSPSSSAPSPSSSARRLQPLALVFSARRLQLQIFHPLTTWLITPVSNAITATSASGISQLCRQGSVKKATTSSSEPMVIRLDPSHCSRFRQTMVFVWK